MYSGPYIEKEKVIEQNKQYQQTARENMPKRDPYQGGYNPQPTQGPNHNNAA